MFERHEGGERAALVDVTVGGPRTRAEHEHQEFIDLVESTDALPVAALRASRDAPDPKYFVGAGKAAEIGERAAETAAELVIFNQTLSPSQVRNLERLCRCRVIDRTELILDIFARRARSHEGKLQVELAQLGYLSTRLVRGWTHLERQKGGIGLRGPGETQLETDRRLLGERIKRIRARLEKVRSQREQGRRARKRAEVPTVAIVGYTNAGKSTLFNRLTDSGVYCEDQLFATLDPTLRHLDLPHGGRIVLADTVGFIRKLPHELVAAFHATLLETCEADLLLHVVDVNSEERDEHIRHVDGVLADLGASDIPQILVYNKVDLQAAGEAAVAREQDGSVERLWVSARSGAGMEALVEALDGFFAPSLRRGWLCLPPREGRLRARLYELGAVREERVADNGALELYIEMPVRRYEEVVARYAAREVAFRDLNAPGHPGDDLSATPRRQRAASS